MTALKRHKPLFLTTLLLGGVLCLYGSIELAVRSFSGRSVIQKKLRDGSFDRYSFVEVQPRSLYERDAKNFWRIKPHYDANFDSLGCRGGSTLLNAPAGTIPFRILFIGDSLFSAVGIPENDTIPNRIVTRLQEKFGAKNVAGINCGVPGYTTYQMLNRLNELLPLIHPTHVIVGFGYGDTVPSMVTDATFAELQRQMQRPTTRWLLRHSLTFTNLFFRKWFRHETRRVTLPEMQEYLSNMRSTTDAAGAKLTLFYMNFTDQIDNLPTVEDFSKNAALPLINLATELKKMQAEYNQKLRAIYDTSTAAQPHRQEWRLPLFVPAASTPAATHFQLKWQAGSQNGQAPFQPVATSQPWLILHAIMAMNDIATLPTPSTLRIEITRNGIAEFDAISPDSLRPHRTLLMTPASPQFVIATPVVFGKVPYMQERVHLDREGFATLGDRTANLFEAMTTF